MLPVCGVALECLAGDGVGQRIVRQIRRHSADIVLILNADNAVFACAMYETSYFWCMSCAGLNSVTALKLNARTLEGRLAMKFHEELCAEVGEVRTEMQRILIAEAVRARIALLRDDRKPGNLERLVWIRRQLGIKDGAA
jgi:hypothetical protein